MVSQHQELHGKRHAVFAWMLALMLLLPSALWAQQTVKGTVTDEDGAPLPGVGVVVKGTRTGTMTNSAGSWTLRLPEGARELEFTCLGMNTEVVPIAGRSVIDVTMKNNTDYIDEVVIVGYGAQKKIHLTGSVAAVSQTELKKATVTNTSQALVGKLPGLITQQSLGQPGSDQVSILVRGYSSYNDAGTVLVLVDGIERDMNTLNPGDIESISVLKDAASCSVYGMKGANGVILVTTRRGDEGTASVSYSGRLILSSPTRLPQMLGGEQYMKYYNLGYQMDQMSTGVAQEDTVPFFTAADIAKVNNGDLSDGIENTSWIDPMLRTTLTHQHNISVSGGSSKVNYYISGAFQRQNGFLEDHYSQRTNVRSNVDARPSKNLKISLNLGLMVQDYNQPGVMSFANGQLGGTVPFCLMYALPFVPQTYEMDAAPQYKGMATSGMRTSGAFVANAVYGASNSGYAKTRTLKVETAARAEYSFPFLKGLKAAFNYSWDLRDIDSKTFAYGYKVMAWNFMAKTFDPEPMMCSNALETGNLAMGNERFFQTILRPEISYNGKFGDHEVSALFLYELNQLRSKKLEGGGMKFGFFDIVEISQADPTTLKSSSSSGISAYAGYVGRINYAYADKYLLEVAARYDGSYKFAKEHRWGFFPSVSAGWVVSNEDFFKDNVSAIDLLKLRGSLGEVGNDNVNPWLYRKSYTTSQNAVAFGQTAQSNLYNTVSYPRYDLTWERIRTYDIGMELSAWKGLLSLEFDWFYKYTYDILNNLGAAYPGSLGGHYPTNQNDGKFDNRGFELSLRHEHRVGDFYYRLAGNVSWARNRILKKTEADNVLPWQSTIGTSIGAIWGYRSDGLYQTQEDLDNAPQGVDVQLGDIKYVDINGDGKLDGDDMVQIGRNIRPELMYALQADLNWKGLDFNIQFQGGALCDKMLLGKWANGVTDANPLTRPFYAGYDNAPLYLVENSWRPDNTDAEYPRLSVNGGSYANNYRVSDFWMRDGAYLRLKNVSVGYTLPSKWTRKINIQNIRLSVTGNNLLTFTQFKYLDPESPNAVTGYYPQQRTVTFGLDITF